MSRHAADCATEDCSGLPDRLRERVLERLGFSSAPSPDLEGLQAIYRSWCTSVPFDNVRKLIALRAGRVLPLPGGYATQFFEDWLDSGAGGTCWPTSNALFELVRSLGFEARRIAGCMRDLGVVNHGSVRVTAGGRDWLIDSSLLSNTPLPLDRDVFVHSDPAVAIEVEFDQSTHVVWSQSPPLLSHLPCRILPDPVSHSYYLERYEASRTLSPFNQCLYARRNRPGEMVLLLGNTRFSKTDQGVRSRALSPEESCDALCRDIGLSERLVGEWVCCGGLADSFTPPSGVSPPPMERRPPSQRKAEPAPFISSDGRTTQMPRPASRR